MSDTDNTDAAEILTDPIEEMTCTGCQSVLDVSEAEPFSEIACPACETPLTVPGRLGEFRLLRRLGSGGMGAIYHALDESLGRHVAVKVMLKSLGDDTVALGTFRREAQMLAALNHPNIVQVYTFGQEKGQPYIVMELVSGKRLNEMIGTTPLLSEGVVVKIAIDVAEGLKAAYDRGLIHGDVKPENILLDTKGTAKVVDFGLASFADKQNEEQGIWGTPYYIAPEKVRKQPADARSDIYSLGATLYHALAGVPPFDGETPVDIVKARLFEEPKPLSKVRDDLLEGVDAAVMRMLEQDPAKRYPNYASLIGDLQKLLEEIKKKSGRVAFDAGKRVVTRKSKRAHGGDGEDAEESPTITKFVMKKKQKSLAPQLSRDVTVVQEKRAGQGSSGGRQATLIVLVLAGALVLAIGGLYGLQKRKARAADLRRLSGMMTQAREISSDKARFLANATELARGLEQEARRSIRLSASNIEAKPHADSALEASTKALENLVVYGRNTQLIKKAKEAVESSVSAATAEVYHKEIAAIANRIAVLEEEISRQIETGRTELKLADGLRTTP